MALQAENHSRTTNPIWKANSNSQIITLPQGGGALHGIGETFSPDLHTGTGNFTVPIAISYATTQNLLLNCYLEGWAEPNMAKILAATTRDYRFHDPFVGSFSRWSLRKYFNRVQNGLSRLGVIGLPDMAFFLRGPMNARSNELQFWREAPRIGLTGVAWIEIGELGVTAERVAYDLNIASDLLRGAR